MRSARTKVGHSTALRLRVLIIGCLCSLGTSLAVMTLNRTSYAARTPGVAQAPDPGSTCTNSFNPLSTTCETWLSRYAFPGSSDDKAAAAAISPDGSRVFVTGHSGLVQTLEDFTTTAYDTATGQQLWVATYDGPGHYVDEARAIATSPDGSRIYITG